MEFAARPSTSATPGTWDDEQIFMFKNAVEPILEFYKAKKETHAPEDEVKSIVKKIVSLAGVTRPPTPAPGSSRPKSATKKADKDKNDKDKNVRFLGECCVCGLEKRGNYDRLGFLCAGCRTVPLKNIQTASSTRVPRVRYSPHYVPSVMYPRKFDYLPEFDAIAAADLTPAASTATTGVAGGGNWSNNLIGASGNNESASLMSGESTSLNQNLSTTHVPSTAKPNTNTYTEDSSASPLSGENNTNDSSPFPPPPPGSNNNNNRDNITSGTTNRSSNASGRGIGTGVTGSADVFGESDDTPGRYTVYSMDVSDRQRDEMFNAVEPLRLLYHPSFLYNFAIARDTQRSKIWVVHETAQPIVLRGALLSGHRCYELLRQISVAALSGLLFLKDFGRSHNDLRPHNFFIDDQHRVKLRLAPFPAQDLPAPFSYENSFFAENEEMQQKNLMANLSGTSFVQAETVDYKEAVVTSPSPDGSTNPHQNNNMNSLVSEGGTTGTSLALSKGASPSCSQFSLRNQRRGSTSHSFASKIDSYCLSRQGTVRRRKTAEQNQDSRDMFVLGVTLTLIAYGDVDKLPLPNDDEVGEDPDELFLVEFIWRLLTGERNPDEALRDDYLTTVRQVDGCAVETIVLRVVGPALPEKVKEELARQQADDAAISKKKKKDGEKKLKFGDEPENNNDSEKKDNNKVDNVDAASRDSNSPIAKKKQMIQAALDSASVRFRVNRWNTAAAKLVSFFSNAEVPAGESESQAADPHLFQIIRTPTQLTFYSVRRDPRLLRARQIAAERQVSSFNNALMASSSMTLAGTAGKMASAGNFSP